MEYQGESIPNLLLPDTVDRSDTDRIVEESPNRRYAKLNQVLGKGAYKIVYKAIDREEGYETTKAEFQELSQEIEILKRVRHPNIIQFHDCWFQNSEFVFITELMTSGTLREYIRKLHIPNLKIVKRWARQILKGLSYLHSNDPPIIHRDIKCDNIFINGAHGEVKIGDMGTAKMKMGKKYTVIGTPEFMAPGIKPDCLQQVTDPEVYDLICNCIGHESERLSAQQIVEHPFLAVEPEVVIINNPDKTHLTMQVVFKGMDRLSVKFDFNVDTDTAEEVVNEMISEEVLPAKYQHLITGEINRIIRELSKPASDEKNKEENRQWNSLQRLESAGRDSGSEGHLSLSRKGSMAEMTPFDNMEDFPIKEYPDDYNIEELVRDTAIATKRGMEKAKEWLTKLNAQDVMTVGDLRDLQEEDWQSLGLTVFAVRSLKNALYGKPARLNQSPKVNPQRTPVISEQKGN
ncbi:signal transducing kinase of the PAK [Boothiomyces sp. JEL0866]|nr:signal transducing kinase of the PAK [Boothiomyces sp. JEL0866]